uniref:glutathione S-transferase-like n=1 Tax=Styela clava TaxID=7725 RepID=UPI0019398E86
FPNLPYIIDGNVKITQSWAIYKYLGRKLGLMPNTDNKICQAEILEGEIRDLRTLNYSFYSPDLYEKQKEIKERQETKIEYLEKYFQGKNFVLGDDISYLDFSLFETLDHHRLFFADIFDKSPNIQAYMKRFESLEKLAKYFNSEKYKKFPISGPMAIWGGKDYDDRK